MVVILVQDTRVYFYGVDGRFRTRYHISEVMDMGQYKGQVGLLFTTLGDSLRIGVIFGGEI